MSRRDALERVRKALKRRDERMAPQPPPPTAEDLAWPRRQMERHVREAWWHLEIASRTIMDNLPHDRAWEDVDEAQQAVEKAAKKLNVKLESEI